MLTGDFFTHWDANSGSRPVSQSWSRTRRYLMKPVIHELGDRPLETITLADVFDMRRHFTDRGDSATTTNRRLASLQAFLRDAALHGWVEQELIDEIRTKVRKVEELAETGTDPFTAEQRDAILEAFRTEAPHYFPFILTAFSTGMRLTELLGLRWNDVELRRRWCRIARSRNKQEVRPCKTRRSRREIKLPQVVVAALAPMEQPEGYIFLTEAGKPIDEGNFRSRIWRPILKELPVPQFAPRCTRHTFVSLALESGWTTAQAAAYVGDKQETIERHYARFTQGWRDLDVDAAIGRQRILKSA